MLDKVDNFANFDAEIALIGCILWDNRNYEKISDFISEEHFVNENNILIFKTIKSLLDRNLLLSKIIFLRIIKLIILNI